MDSNLTLAHITHNTAVILLHQAIAYPPHHWRSCPVKLPSSSSAETCIEAATEIAELGQQFLLYARMLTNPQFAFCLFIAGRMLLTHSRYKEIPVLETLHTLIASLFEISARWAGPRDVDGPEKENLASVFAKRLVQARGRDDTVRPLARTPSLDIRQAVYSETEEALPSSRLTDAQEHGLSQGHGQAQEQARTANGSGAASTLIASSSVSNHEPQLSSNITSCHLTSDAALMLAFPPLPLSFQQNSAGSAPFFDQDADPFGLGLEAGVRGQEGAGWSGNGMGASFY
jgi:hypothetical protein